MSIISSGFTAIRIGIKEHIEAGQFSDRELGVYLFLQLYARWDCGVCWTTASSIKGTFKHKDVKLRTVQNSLNRLRAKEYVDYPKGDGTQWSYPVLLVKAQCTDGVLKGCRTISFYDAEKEYVLYDLTDAEDADHVRKVCCLLYSTLMEEVRSRWGAGAVVVRLQDVKTGKMSKHERLQDQKTRETAPESSKGHKVGQ